MKRLTVYVRGGCHLCDAMLDELDSSRQQGAFELEVVDILGRPELESRYGSLIPVLCAEGDVEICHYYLDESALAQYFSQP
ncbi:MAG: glutaredoxin family protein [Desulfobulbia bacterium]